MSLTVDQQEGELAEAGDLYQHVFSLCGIEYLQICLHLMVFSKMLLLFHKMNILSVKFLSIL